MEELIRRLDAVEKRLANIESRLADKEDPVDLSGMEVDEEPMFIFEPIEEVVAAPRPIRGRLRAATGQDRQKPLQAALSVTTLLGWAGAMALVLAAAYLVKLGIDGGWLTPARRMVGAVLGGLVLIGIGLFLKDKDRQYASLLPAGGVVILFLSIYGAHLRYGLIHSIVAIAAVGLVCILSLWLCRVFAAELYALFAVIGSYTAPLLLEGLRHSVLDLAIYYSAWGIIFCVYAVWIGQRRIYLLALYLSLIGFDFVWRIGSSTEWLQAFSFQCVQLLIFATVTVVFSVRRSDPLNNDSALLHVPALLIFYLLQYTLLDKHLPAMAPWIAVSSAAFVALLYVVGKSMLHRELPGGKLLLSTYVAMVLFHAGYLEALPFEWAPWVALLAAPALIFFGFSRHNLLIAGWPVTLVVGAIFVINYLRVGLDAGLDEVFAGQLLVAVYAAELYLGYWLARRARLAADMTLPLIYAGHVAMLAAAVQWFDGRLAVSACWGALALITLGLALLRSDRMLGQSSLLIFAVCGIKVLLYDLAGAAPLVRIACLVVAGVTFYLGGWLYRKVALLETEDGDG